MRRLLLVLSVCVACRGGPPAPSAPQSVDAALRERCCAQCSAAAARDPAGMDLRDKPCTSYPAEWNSGPGVDDECRGWFVARAQAMTVGDCAAP